MVPYLDVHECDGGEADTRRVAELGIHHCRSDHPPHKSNAIHAAYTPNDDE